MAVYKVPQDVEADDKLIGPFSFRQFIYLIVVAISGAACFGLSQLFIPLAIIPLPLILFFGALALPLRKDQPMETYLSAVVSFYFLKPRRRFWQPDGIDSFVTIIPPKDEDIRRTKDLNEDEATRRLGYLADLVDSHGWSVRGQGVPAPDTSINSDLYYESQATSDMMDTNNAESQRLSQGLAQSTADARQNAISHMQTAPSGQSMTDTALANPLLQGTQQSADPQFADQYDPATPFNPVQQPQARPIADSTQRYMSKDDRDAIAYAAALAEEAEESRRSGISYNENAQSTSVTPTSDATMERAKIRAQELASRDDISLQTMSEEANRLQKKDHDQMLSDGDEVTISLR
jgi:hypothetical protein